MSTYVAESQLASSREGWELDLATAWARTPDGIVENPEFFTGFLDRPDVFAAGLLSVADVASTRYVDASPLVIKDPVVTGSGDRLRLRGDSFHRLRQMGHGRRIQLAGVLEACQQYGQHHHVGEVVQQQPEEGVEVAGPKPGIFHFGQVYRGRSWAVRSFGRVLQ